MTVFRTRPRRAAVALFALVGCFVGAGALTESADAQCIRAKVWIYKAHEGRDYKYDDCDPETPWETHTTVTFVSEVDEPLPPGTPSGGGFEIWLTDV